MFKLAAFAVFLAVMMTCLSAQAATPVYKCTIKGSVTYQPTPCPSGETRPPPTVEQLNAERQKKLQQASDGTGKASSSATGAQGPSKTATGSALPESVRTERSSLMLTPKTPSALSFRCDGRRYCPQMKSCEEAKYFLANCPGVKMDGDGDGIPCEDQLCGH